MGSLSRSEHEVHDPERVELLRELGLTGYADRLAACGALMLGDGGWVRSRCRLLDCRECSAARSREQASRVEAAVRGMSGARAFVLRLRWARTGVALRSELEAGRRALKDLCRVLPLRGRPPAGAFEVALVENGHLFAHAHLAADGLTPDMLPVLDAAWQARGGLSVACEEDNLVRDLAAFSRYATKPSGWDPGIAGDSRYIEVRAALSGFRRVVARKVRT